jgi:hypothetical protein
MTDSIRERALAGLKAALDRIPGISGLTVFRNEDTGIEKFPALVQMDAESAQRVIERAAGVTLYALTVTLEGYVSATVPANTGSALSDLYARTWRVAKGAETSVPEIGEVLEGTLETMLVTEEGVAPHAFFSLEVEIRFGTVPDDPFTQA